MNVRKSYNTRQKGVILAFFKKNSEKCYTAKDIIEGKDISVGEATVYRHLAKLAEDNKLKKFTMDNKSGTFYQYNDESACTNHYHLKCVKCGNIVHLDCTFMLNMEQHIAQNHNFSVDHAKTVIYGICESCK